MKKIVAGVAGPMARSTVAAAEHILMVIMVRQAHRPIVRLLARATVQNLDSLHMTSIKGKIAIEACNCRLKRLYEG